MRIEKYRCDGCGQEDTLPHGWMSMVPLRSVSGTAHSTDYCSSCLDKMRAALPIKPKKPAERPLEFSPLPTNFSAF